MKPRLAKPLIFCLALCLSTGAEARGYGFSFFEKAVIATAVVGAAVAIAHRPCGNKSSGKHACKPNAGDGLLADTTTVATPSSDAQSVDTGTPWRDASAPDVLIDGFDTAPDIEGVPGRYWEGMTSEDILIEKRGSVILGENLEASGEARMPGDAAHHIVEETRPSANSSRRKLYELGVDINSAENGVFLPHLKRSPPRTYHGDTYKASEYTAWVGSQIADAETRDEVAAALQFIKNTLIKGGTPWKNSTK